MSETNKNKATFNLVIVGVGGQGVMSLSRVFQSLCQNLGLSCQSSMIKGGAQRLGTVYSQLRIFTDKNENYSSYSPTIADGKADLLIALEPWEGLRFENRLSPKGRLIINSDEIPLMVRRLKKLPKSNPIDLIKTNSNQVTQAPFTQQAVAKWGSNKMLNYLMGTVALKYIHFIPDETFQGNFQNLIPKAKFKAE